jgi:ferrous iron transport protein A
MEKASPINIGGIWEKHHGEDFVPCNLDTLEIGSVCNVLAITGERTLRRRLMEMGLLEGSRIRLVKFGPSGDPIQIQVNDYFLSLRRNEAAKVVVLPKGFGSDKKKACSL